MRTNHTRKSCSICKKKFPLTLYRCGGCERYFCVNEFEEIDEQEGDVAIISITEGPFPGGVEDKELMSIFELLVSCPGEESGEECDEVITVKVEGTITFTIDDCFELDRIIDSYYYIVMPTEENYVESNVRNVDDYSNEDNSEYEQWLENEEKTYL